MRPRGAGEARLACRAAPWPERRMPRGTRRTRRGAGEGRELARGRAGATGPVTPKAAAERTWTGALWTVDAEP